MKYIKEAKPDKDLSSAELKHKQILNFFGFGIIYNARTDLREWYEPYAEILYDQGTVLCIDGESVTSGDIESEIRRLIGVFCYGVQET